MGIIKMGLPHSHVIASRQVGWINLICQYGGGAPFSKVGMKPNFCWRRAGRGQHARTGRKEGDDDVGQRDCISRLLIVRTIMIRKSTVWPNQKCWRNEHGSLLCIWHSIWCSLSEGYEFAPGWMGAREVINNFDGMDQCAVWYMFSMSAAFSHVYATAVTMTCSRLWCSSRRIAQMVNTQVCGMD